MEPQRIRVATPDYRQTIRAAVPTVEIVSMSRCPGS